MADRNDKTASGDLSQPTSSKWQGLGDSLEDESSDDEGGGVPLHGSEGKKPVFKRILSKEDLALEPGTIEEAHSDISSKLKPHPEKEAKTISWSYPLRKPNISRSDAEASQPVIQQLKLDFIKNFMKSFVDTDYENICPFITEGFCPHGANCLLRTGKPAVRVICPQYRDDIQHKKDGCKVRMAEHSNGYIHRGDCKDWMGKKDNEDKHFRYQLDFMAFRKAHEDGIHGVEGGQHARLRGSLWRD